MSIIDNELTEKEQERVARIRQEIVENKHELASKLYKYSGPSLKGAGCFLGKGDIMIRQNENMFSSRGVMLPVSSEQLVEMLDDKTMSKLFDMDDINADEFDAKLEEVLQEMAVQASYQDASYYMTNDDNSYGLATYVSEQDPDLVIAQVECRNDEFTITPMVVPEEVTSQLRECTYNEFNPGARELRIEIANTNKETTNKGSAYAKLQKEYLANGRNDIKEPGEILKDNKMSAKDKLFACKEAVDEINEQNRQSEVNANVEDDIFPMSKTAKRMGI